MSGGFGTLIYTDCLRGQGLRGDPGLQFQAKSPDVGAAVMDLVQRTLLYEAPAAWVNDRRPTEEYPPSLAHVWDPAGPVLGTAQGAYLGKEASGMRQGNQLTHAIVTADPGSYGFVRPAQLLHAPFWVAEPAATTGSAPLEPGWQPGPYEPEAIRDFVAAQEDGRDLLLTLVSALYRVGEPRADRVLFVADSPSQVIQWIAAATLLLPQRRALAVGFKVFTTNPAYCPLPVLAVHPDWAGPYRSVDGAAGFVVLDLLTRRRTAIEPDAEARHWVSLFLEADIYDVMDAVELADTVAAAGASPGQARAVAVAAVLGGRPDPADVPAAADWVASGAADLVARHGEALVAVLLPGAAARQLQLLDAAAVSGRVAGAAREIRAALLRGEIDGAARTGDAPDERLPAIPRHLAPDADRRAGAALVAEAVRAAPDEAVDALLRVAWRHRLNLPISAWAGRAARFAAWWAAWPDLAYDPARWPCGAELLDLLRDELAARLAAPAGHAAARAAVRDHWWRLLVGTASDPVHDLDAAVLAAAMGAGDRDFCLRLLRQVLHDAGHAADPAVAVARACAVLWETRDPGPREALAALAVIPGPVPVDVVLISAVTTALEDGWPTGDLAEGLDAAAAVARRGARVPAPWRDRHQDDLRLDGLCATLAAAAGRKRDLSKELGAVGGEVLTARAGRIAVALAHNQDPDFVARILADLPKQIGPLLLAELARGYPSRPELTVRQEFALLRSKHLPAPLRRKLEEDLRRHVRKDEGRLVKAVATMLARQGGALLPDWEAWTAHSLRPDDPGWPARDRS